MPPGPSRPAPPSVLKPLAKGGVLVLWIVLWSQLMWWEYATLQHAKEVRHFLQWGPEHEHLTKDEKAEAWQKER